ncbi:MAG: hypothetical protein NZ840_12050 [Anaerolineales bacterium]|nr:hypothetical protein [Anaerolineales bacterium]MDW8162767.1 hypothetical protein [Anaerolineales bacterium]
MSRFGCRTPVLFILGIWVVLTQGLYLYAALQTHPSYVFGGFLLNPLDGNTYLSKMQQGWEGKWLFELTYSVERNRPAFLFVFYLLLGHLSRILGLKLLTVYHLTRLVAALLLFVLLRKHFQWLFEREETVRVALAWVIFGGGMGWLAMAFGGFPPDLWVVEGYVFLSVLTNPHFPLAIALMVWAATLSEVSLNHPLNFWGALLCGIFLANLSPFAFVLILGALSFYLFFAFFWRHTGLRAEKLLLRVVGLGMGGLPFLLYQFWVVRQDAVLAGWNRQNVTPSPDAGSFLLGYFPLAVWALVGAVRVGKKEAKFVLPLVWVLVSLILVYFPSPLQRRFMIGLYIPMVALAMLAYREVAGSHEKRLKGLPLSFWLNLSVGVSMVTNLILLFAAFNALQRRDPSLFLYREETEAFQWLRERLPRDGVVLAAPTSGNLIPAWTGLRVVYGHPFETIHAAERKAQVERFYRGEMSLEERESFLAAHSVDAVVWGVREREIATEEMEEYLERSFPVGYRSGQVTIYLVGR